MAYSSLATLLDRLGQTSEWQQPQHFLRLLEQWPHIAGEMIAQQSFPVNLNAQGILTVAVASSTWAHHLTFLRSQLLAKIQHTLGIELQDIRFSHRYWSAPRPAPPATTTPLQRATTLPKLQNPAKTPQEAFQRWQQQVQQRSRSLGTCPVCQCPTPATELHSWGVCGLCYVRQRPV
ncbi:DUF721 domain-containing protein [Parathermosynechococcus lividus]|nr:DUF721 domain-containing protein [Synechococcus sp. PCC 6716]